MTVSCTRIWCSWCVSTCQPAFVVLVHTDCCALTPDSSDAQAIDEATARFQAGVHQSLGVMEQEALTVMRIPRQAQPPQPPVPRCLPGTFCAADEAAIDADLVELRARLATRTAERQGLQQQHRAEGEPGAMCGELLLQLLHVAGSAASAERLLHDVSVLGDRANGLRHTTDAGLAKAGM